MANSLFQIVSPNMKKRNAKQKGWAKAHLFSRNVHVLQLNLVFCRLRFSSAFSNSTIIITHLKAPAAPTAITHSPIHNRKHPGAVCSRLLCVFRVPNALSVDGGYGIYTLVHVQLIQFSLFACPNASCAIAF